MQARPVGGAPLSYTVGAGASLAAAVPITGAYDVAQHGPDGFFRWYAGPPGGASVDVAVEGGAVVPANPGRSAVTVRVVDAHTRWSRSVTVPAHGSVGAGVRIGPSGWYDVTVTAGDVARQVAGQGQTGARSTSDPQLGR